MGIVGLIGQRAGGRRGAIGWRVIAASVLAWILFAATARAADPISSPVIIGTATQGATLTEAHGVWSVAPTSYTYQWQDCETGGACTDIAGATSQTYTLTATDVGHTVRVLETAFNAGTAEGAAAASAPTAVVTGNLSTTSILVLQGLPDTNQSVTLIATVTSQSSQLAPSGTVAFENDGIPISGCASEQVSPTGQSVTVACQAPFAAAGSPAYLTAVFTPSATGSVGGSTSPTENLPIGRDNTVTSVAVSSPSVKLGSTVTYTATVSPLDGGPFDPSGLVVFLDGGKGIASCTKQALQKRSGYSVATCSLKYNKAGKHAIEAHYDGDPNFWGSTSTPARPVLASQVAGTIQSTVSWSFFYTPAFTRVLSLVVHRVPTDTMVQVSCHGRGCPFRENSTMARTKPCTQKPGQKCPTTPTANLSLVSHFLGSRLRVGAQISIALTRPDWIGKHYSFTVRGGRAPHIQIGCLVPTGAVAGAGC